MEDGASTVDQAARNPVQEVRQDGHDGARHVEAHRPTRLGSGLCM